MGFAYSDLSVLGAKTVFDDMVIQNNIRDIFSICLRVKKKFFKFFYIF